MEIFGVTHPIPTKFAERIYHENKTVFVGKRCLFKASKGDKFVIYESKGEKAYTGWADIKYIGEMDTNKIMKNYGKKLMITEQELKDYSNMREDMTIIEFDNFEKFNKPVKPVSFVTVGGKYIYEKEYEDIRKNKD